MGSAGTADTTWLTSLRFTPAATRPWWQPTNPRSNRPAWRRDGGNSSAVYPRNDCFYPARPHLYLLVPVTYPLPARATHVGDPSLGICGGKAGLVGGDARGIRRPASRLQQLCSWVSTGSDDIEGARLAETHMFRSNQPGGPRRSDTRPGRELNQPKPGPELSATSAPINTADSTQVNAT